MNLESTIIQTIQELENDNIPQKEPKPIEKESDNCDKKFLKDIHERLAVLFEGLQSPNAQNIETKLDITINFLQYLLIRLDKKINE